MSKSLFVKETLIKLLFEILIFELLYLFFEKFDFWDLVPLSFFYIEFDRLRLCSFILKCVRLGILESSDVELALKLPFYVYFDILWVVDTFDG